jgi:hypothetical protein
MQRTAIVTSEAPAGSTYSQAILVGDFVFVGIGLER